MISSNSQCHSHTCPCPLLPPTAVPIQYKFTLISVLNGPLVTALLIALGRRNSGIHLQLPIKSNYRIHLRFLKSMIIHNVSSDASGARVLLIRCPSFPDGSAFYSTLNVCSTLLVLLMSLLNLNYVNNSYQGSHTRPDKTSSSALNLSVTVLFSTPLTRTFESSALNGLSLLLRAIWEQSQPRERPI